LTTQDKGQGSDRAIAAGVQNDKSSCGRDEELAGLFQLLFEATSAANGQASSGDFSCIRELLQQRRHILDRVHELTAGSRPEIRPISESLRCQLRTMLESTLQENIHILKLLQERKKIVLTKMTEVQNRRHVFHYLR